MNELTGGESSASNVELIKNNAAIGAQIAVKLSQLTRSAVSVAPVEELGCARKVTVIGGCAVDIISKSETIHAGSYNSHVGQIAMHEGGSTRNAAECLARLGFGPDTTFISAVGDDEKSILIRSSLERVGLSSAGLCVKSGERTAAFSGVLNGAGEFFCGVADMDVLNIIPREHLDGSKFWQSKVLLIDSNIGVETLDYVLSRSSAVEHVIYEPISQEKSERILERGFLSRLTCFKPNLVQLKHLVGKIGGKATENLTELSGNFEHDKRLIKLMVAHLAKYAEDTATGESRLRTILVTLGAAGVLVFEAGGG